MAEAKGGGGRVAATWVRRLDQISAAAVLLMAPGMVHAYVLAEICIGAVALAFLARCALLGDWAWLRTPWVILAALWWLWLVFCSLPGIGRGGVTSVIQAVVVVRYLVMVAALEHQVLRDELLRRWLWRVLALCAAYIALQTYLQAFTGHNLFGQARWPSGELTGPFDKPRAGAPFSRLFFVALLPPAMALLERSTRVASLAALALTVAALAAQVLIGQRMPLLLVVMGFVVSANLLARLRRPAAIALVGAAVLIAASAVLVPPTFYRLVTKFSAQMESFPTSPYGELAARAAAMAEQHPWTGRGFNGFRTGCADPRYFHGWTWPANPKDDGGGLAGCNIHPHNHYLQALTDAGFPGVILFAALVVSWLVVLGRDLWRAPAPLRVGLFVALLIQQWPIASTSSAFAIEIGGLSFLLLGFGLALARNKRVR